MLRWTLGCMCLFQIWFRKAFLSLLAILWNSAFKWVYLSFSPLPFTCLLSSVICKTSSDDHFTFLHFFFLEMVLITTSYTMSWSPFHSSSSILSDLVPWIYLSLPLCNHKGFDFSHTWMAWWFPYFLQFKSVQLSILDWIKTCLCLSKSVWKQNRALDVTQVSHYQRTSG